MGGGGGFISLLLDMRPVMGGDLTSPNPNT